MRHPAQGAIGREDKQHHNKLQERQVPALSTQNKTPPRGQAEYVYTMKKQLFLLLLAAATLFAGCSSKEDGDKGGTFTPPTNEQLSQNAYADNETTGEGFTFTTDTPWTATVTEVKPQTEATRSDAAVTGNKVSWIKLFVGDDEAYSGGAGTITIRIEIEQNYTGERREATITITSGSNTFTVTVVQEGTKEDGSENEPPVQVTGITLNQTALRLKVGETVTLEATVEPADATVQSVSWSTSDPEVATVNTATGEVTAIADGTATVTATSTSNKKVSATCSIVVGDAGFVPTAYVSQIDRVVNYWEIIPEDERYDEDATFTFEYDNSDRVVSYAVDIRPAHPDHKSNRLESTLDYSAPDHIAIKDSWSDTGSETYNAAINEKGFVTECLSSPDAHDATSDMYYPFKLEYDAEDRVSRLSYDDYWNTFEYKDGLLSGGTFHIDGETFHDTGLEADFSDIANDKMNIDLNYILIPGLMAEEPEDADLPGRVGRLGMLRMTGRSIDRLINTYGGAMDDEDANVGYAGGWPEPNAKVEMSYEDYETEGESMPELKYNLNEDGTVQSVEISIPMVKVLTKYYIISSDEYMNPDHPEVGYKFYETERTNTVLDRGTTTITYSLTYR